jgi:hypothetical protein
VLGKINLALSFDEKAKEPLPFAPAVDIRVVRSMLVTSLKTPSVSEVSCRVLSGKKFCPRSVTESSLGDGKFFFSTTTYGGAYVVVVRGQ